MQSVNTVRLRRKSNLTPFGFMLICFIVVVAAYFINNLLPKEVVDTTYKTPKELYVDHETKAMQQLLNSELKKSTLRK